MVAISFNMGQAERCHHSQVLQECHGPYIRQIFACEYVRNIRLLARQKASMTPRSTRLTPKPHRSGGKPRGSAHSRCANTLHVTMIERTYAHSECEIGRQLVVFVGRCDLQEVKRLAILLRMCLYAFAG